MPKRKRDEEDGRLLLAKGERVAGGAHTYTIERVLGKGGFSTVYLARDEQGHPVALKESIAVASPRDREHVQRLFQREQEIMEAVSGHELFPQFIEGFSADNYRYLAQQYIEGELLSDLIAQRAPFDQQTVVRWGISLCDALSYLHFQNIVHHDIKAANIKIRPDGTPIILDFGAAQRYGAKQNVDLYGTDGYMAPEFARQWEHPEVGVDKRTDVFAMGCLLYQLLTGEMPEQKDINAQGFILGPLTRRMDLNPQLVNVVFTASSYDPNYRYANAQDMLAQLRALAEPELRVSRTAIDFGRVRGTHALFQDVLVYNAGGQKLRCDVYTQAAWLEIRLPGAERPAGGHFDGNRQIVRVIARLDRIAAKGAPLSAVVYLRWQKGEVGIPVTLTLLPDEAHIVAHRSLLEQTVKQGRSTIAIRLKNIGEDTARLKCVAIEARPREAASLISQVQPPVVTLPRQMEEEVRISVDTTGFPPATYQLALVFEQEGDERLQVPLTLRVVSTVERLKGLLSAIKR
ncbi:MAG: serine/threonine protein kinase [Abditibacteriales bacterium]|nr:serine/threonine protein kinase [Abditibacteriales bacterium]MDW8364763.1 serine/threonine-protein kinase [Abditibacteriales bacterium]